jgi:hypothetical protein
MGVLTIFMALLGLVTLARFLTAPESEIARNLLEGFVVCVVASTWISNLIMLQRRKR